LVLLEHPHLARVAGVLGVSSQDPAPPKRRTACGSALGSLRGLAEVPEKAGGIPRVCDEREQAHATAATYARFDVDPGSLHRLRRGSSRRGGGRTCRFRTPQAT